MPKAEEIFAKLAGKSLFVKIYMSEAYTQLILNESSQLLATINTPLGLAVTLFQIEYLRRWPFFNAR